MRNETTPYPIKDSWSHGVSASLEEWNSPSSKALRGLQAVMMDKRPRAFVQALKECRAQGIDINKVLKQDHPDMAVTLGAFLASQPASNCLGLLKVLFEQPDFRPGQHAAYFVASGQTVVRPLVHCFIDGWMLHLGDAPFSGAAGYDRKHALARSATTLLDEAGVDWNAQDSQGHTVLHDIMLRIHGNTARGAIIKMLNVGVDPAIKNNAGLTAIDVGRIRLAQHIVKLPDDRSSKESYEWALSHLEHCMLQATVPSPSAPLRRGPRL